MLGRLTRIQVFSRPDLEIALAIFDIAFLFVKLHNLCVSWALVNILQELLDSIWRSLSFALNLQHNFC